MILIETLLKLIKFDKKKSLKKLSDLVNIEDNYKDFGRIVTKIKKIRKLKGRILTKIGGI